MGPAKSGKPVLRSLVLWLGLIALSIQGLVPLCASAATHGSGSSIVICTTHGYETVQVDEDGNPVAPVPQSDHATCFLCLGCHLGGGFTAPSLIAFALPDRAAQTAPQFIDAAIPASRAHLPYTSRAPPAAWETIAA
jgi:DUF2946 family protein